jgi:hypothetical protein
MKLVDKIALLNGLPFYTFELFPPSAADDFEHLTARIPHFAQLNPTSVSITWGAGGSPTDRSLELAYLTQQTYNIDTELHLTCTNLTTDRADAVLRVCSTFITTRVVANAMHRVRRRKGLRTYLPCAEVAFIPPKAVISSHSSNRSSPRARALDANRSSLRSRHRPRQIHSCLTRVLFSIQHSCRRYVRFKGQWLYRST